MGTTPNRNSSLRCKITDIGWPDLGDLLGIREDFSHSGFTFIVSSFEGLNLWSEVISLPAAFPSWPWVTQSPLFTEFVGTSSPGVGYSVSPARLKFSSMNKPTARRSRRMINLIMNPFVPSDESRRFRICECFPNVVLRDYQNRGWFISPVELSCAIGGEEIGIKAPHHFNYTPRSSHITSTPTLVYLLSRWVGSTANLTKLQLTIRYVPVFFPRVPHHYSVLAGGQLQTQGRTLPWTNCGGCVIRSTICCAFLFTWS